MLGTRTLVAFAAILLSIGCSSSNDGDKNALTPEEQAELRRIVDENMLKLPATLQLSEVQRQDIKPYTTKARDKLFTEARRYHSNPNPKALRRFENETQKLFEELKKNIQPFMTQGQLNNFMVVIDRTLQQVRTARLKRNVKAPSGE
ncbi:MAG: hypothetical protein ACYTGZ_06205 [Planctomycetota bacterium]|jgi:hypothetical protein